MNVHQLLDDARLIAERVIYAETGGYEGDTNSERKSTAYLAVAFLKRLQETKEMAK